MSDIDLLADAREWLSQQDTRPRTHSARCHMWHPVCLVTKLVRDLSRSGQSEAKARDFDADCPARDNTLTDAEREAIAFMLRHAAVAADGLAFADSADYRRHHDAVFGLLDRTPDGRNRQ